MKKTFTFILLSFAIITSVVQAQVINSKINKKTFSAPKTYTTTDSDALANQPTEQTIANSQNSNSQETIPAEAEQNLPATLTQEQKNEFNKQMQNELKDSLKNNSLRERVEFLDINNYIDKRENTKQLFRKSKDYKLSVRKNQNKTNTNIDLKNDDQVNDFIFKKANIIETPKLNQQP